MIIALIRFIQLAIMQACTCEYLKITMNNLSGTSQTRLSTNSIINRINAMASRAASYAKTLSKSLRIIAVARVLAPEFGQLKQCMPVSSEQYF